MVRKLQIRELVNGSILMLFFLVVGLVMLWDVKFSAVDALRGAVTLTDEMDLAEMEGQYVSYEVKYPLGEYMEVTKTTKVNGISTGTKKDRSSYMVLDGERGVCLSVQVPVKLHSDMEDLTDRFYLAFETGEDFPETGIVVTGSLERLEGEELGYFEEFMDYLGFPMESVTYQISDGMIHGNKMSNVYGLTAFGLVMVLIAWFLLFLALKDPVKKRVNRYLEQHPGVTMEQLEAEFASSEKIGCVWIGKNWTICSSLMEVVLTNSEIVWVHTGKERSGRNVSCYIYWNMIDGSELKASMSEKKCKQVMERYTSYPHIVVGNNPEYGYLFQRDREAFLDLKYRQNIQ